MYDTVGFAKQVKRLLRMPGNMHPYDYDSIQEVIDARRPGWYAIWLPRHQFDPNPECAYVGSSSRGGGTRGRLMDHANPNRKRTLELQQIFEEYEDYLKFSVVESPTRRKHFIKDVEWELIRIMDPIANVQGPDSD